MGTRRDRATSEATARAILTAWHDGRLGEGPGPVDGARIELLGTGETYAAWHVTQPEGPGWVVRVATRRPDDLARPMAQEAAALPYVPVGSGPRLVAVCLDDGPASPLGLPFIVTTHQPGMVVDPLDWGPAQLHAHAAALARLHRDRFPGRGEFRLGQDRLAGLRPGPMSLLDEFDTAMTWWRDHHPGLWQDVKIAEIVTAARQRCRAAEPAFGELDSYRLVHGDLCATNVLWEDGSPHYIDFEWAQAGDPARDLAIIGGPVHGGPWYVPLDDAGIDDLLDHYVRESSRLGQHLDRAALRRRRDGWEAYERTAMLLYVSHRAAEGRTGFGEIARALATRLAATLRARRGV